MLPPIKKALAIRSVKEVEKKRKDAVEALKKELTGYLAKCLECEFNGKCSMQEIIQRNLDFAPADGQLHYDIE